MQKLEEEKKGDVTDIFVFIVLTFIMGVGLFTFAFIIPTITEGLEASTLNSSVETNNAIEQLERYGTEGMQRGFLLLFSGLVIGTFISAFLVRSHPIFLFLYILMAILATFTGVYLANAYDDLRNVSIFADTLASQGMINIVFENLLLITIAVAAVSMIIVFSKFGAFGRTPGGDSF